MYRGRRGEWIGVGVRGWVSGLGFGGLVCVSLRGICKLGWRVEFFL